MRCDDCQPDLLAQARYCDCCGRDLPHDTSDDSAAAVSSPHESWAPSPVPEAMRCESCGGPTAGDSLCAVCHTAFQGILAKGQPRAAEETLALAPEVGRPVDFTPSASSKAPVAQIVPAATVVASPPPPAPAPVGASARPVAERKPHPPRAPNPEVPARRPAAPAPSRPGGRTLWMAAAGVAAIIVTVMALSVTEQWFERRAVAAPADPAATPFPGQPSMVPETDATREPGRLESPGFHQVRAAEGAGEHVTSQSPKLAKPVAGRRPARVPPKVVRQVKTAPRETPAPDIPLLAAEPPAPVALARAASSIAPASPAPVPVAAPVGRFFEISQVNEPPRVASRVEPRVPDSLQGGPLNDVVIMRVLVSQAGQASMVNVLRRSKAGAGLDEAVIAAVKQWTFSPAKKRGEAVSCWFNVGVPLSRSE